MSFFKDFKEDLSLAVNELMPEETAGAAQEGGDAELDEGSLQDPEEMSERAQKEAGQEKDPEDDFASAEDFLRPEDFMDLDGDEADKEPVREEPEAAGEEPVVAASEHEAVEPEFLPEPESVTYEDEAGDQADQTPDSALPESEEAGSVLEEQLKQAFGAEEEDTSPVVDEQVNNIIKGEDKTMNEELLEGLDAVENEAEGLEEATDETAIITEGMTITGDVASKGSMEVTGTVIGNIEVRGKITVTGRIQGNSKAAEFYAESAKINGEIHSTGTVKVGQSSVIIGDIGATNAVIAGAVKGDIDVKGPVILDSTAIVMGNIKSKSIQINNGAVIEGLCSQCYAEVNPTHFFDDVN